MNNFHDVQNIFIDSDKNKSSIYTTGYRYNLKMFYALFLLLGKYCIFLLIIMSNGGVNTMVMFMMFFISLSYYSLFI